MGSMENPVSARPDGPLLEVDGVTIQYKTKEYLVTATYRVDFNVYKSRFALPSSTEEAGQILETPSSDRGPAV